MRRFVDLKEMPGWNPNVPNGADSISRGVLVIEVISGKLCPRHIRYGALNKVTPEGIWRCLTSHEGCWEVQDNCSKLCIVTHRDGTKEAGLIAYAQDRVVTVRFETKPKVVPGHRGWQTINFSYRDIPEQYVEIVKETT